MALRTTAAALLRIVAHTTSGGTLENLSMLATWYAHCSSSATAREGEIAFNELAAQVFDEIEQRLPGSVLSETNAMLRYSVDVARINHLLDSAATTNQALQRLAVVSRRAAELNNAAEHAAVLYNVGIKLQQAARFAESSEVLRVSLDVDRAPNARARTASALAYNELTLGQPDKALEAAAIAVESDEPIARYLFAKASIACASTRSDIDVRAVTETYARTTATVDALALDLVAHAVAHCTPEQAAHFCAALRDGRGAVEQAKVIGAHVAALLQRRPQSDDAVESGCRAVAQLRDAAADAADAASLIDEATQLHEKVWAAGGARWRASEVDAALELFELSEPLIAASDVEKRASAQRMIAACSVNLNMLDDASKSLAIAKQLEAAGGLSAPSAATTALEFRLQVKRGDVQGAHATIKQIAALPLSGAERLEQLQLCAHVADAQGSSELCTAALTEALGACAAEPPLHSTDYVTSFGTLLRMLVLEVVRNDAELGESATVRAVARVFESAEPHLETHVTADEAMWLAGAAWHFGRAALLHHASETAAVALFWSTSATLECRMAHAGADGAAAHTDNARMAATFALAAAVEHAWKEDKHSRALIERVALAERRLASIADVGRANAAMAQATLYYGYLAALLRVDSAALAHAVDAAIAGTSDKLLDTMASAALEAEQPAFAFRLLREHVTRAHGQIAATSNRAPSAEQVALVARLARHALHAAPTRDAAFELLTSAVTPLSEHMSDDDLAHMIATAWNNGVYLHRMQMLDKCEQWLAAALELVSKSPRMRAIYEAQIRSGYAQVVAKVKPSADAIVQQELIAQL
jgi:hypothetical protein